MAGRSSSASRVRSSSVVDFDDQMWPVNCAILVLSGFVVGIVIGNSDFTDPRPLWNGYAHLAVIGLLMALSLGVAYWLGGKIRRRLQFCVLLSLLVHLSTAFYVYCNPVRLPIIADVGAAGGGGSQPDEEVIVPDYHWVQAEEPDVEQVFDTPVATEVRDENPPSAVMQPRDLERPVPVADVPRSPRAEATPLGSGGPGIPLEMHRPAVAMLREVQQVAALPMNREVKRALDLPKLEAQVPLPLPAISRLRPAELRPGSIAAQKAQAPKDITAASSPDNASAAMAAGGRSVVRWASEPGQPLPAMTTVAQLPSAVAPRVSGAPEESGGTTAMPSQPATLIRSARGGQSVPSAILPDEDEQGMAPAAVGSSLGSRIEATSKIAVERSTRGQAPAGDKIAAAGTQEFGIGSGLRVARTGVPYGRGSGRPSVSGLSGVDQAALRAGALGSFSDHGAPLSIAAARRAMASQPGGSGSGLSPNLSATLPRTQTSAGNDLPSAALPSDRMAMAGAGGLSASAGGTTSNLDVGSAAAVQRTLGAGTPAGRNTLAAGTLDFGTGSSAVALLPGTIPGARYGLVTNTDAGSGVPRSGTGGEQTVALVSGGIARAAGAGVSTDATAEMVGEQSVSPVAAAKAAEPVIDASLGTGSGQTAPGGVDLAVDRVTGRRMGTPAGTSDLADLGGGGTVRSPQPAGISTRRAREDAELIKLISGSASGRNVVGRSDGQLTVEGAVKEPTEFYQRRNAAHRGLGPGNVDGGGFTEPAVELGLDFFTRIQFPDGHWSIDKFPDSLTVESPGLGEMQADTAATGLVLLTYLGAGYTHLDEKYRSVVRRGVEWLVKHQKPDGDLFAGGSRFTHFYSHGMAAMALCEVYGMTQDPELREPARKAVEFIVNTQDPRRGGWRYDPGQESDTSVTGWQLMALKSAQMAGLDVPEATFQKIRGWLDRAQGPEQDGRHVYNPWNQDTPEQREGRMPSLAMTAEAMLMRMYLGQRRDNPQLVQGAEYLRANLPEVGTREQPQRDCYYWYYATQAMYQMQGEFWTAWNNQLGPLLKAGQVQSGELVGSWNPREPVPDRWGHAGGRVYVTAMHLLMLEVYYRHLPLFQELSK